MEVINKVFLCLLICCFGCNSTIQRPIISEAGLRLGDSIFVNHQLVKVIFSDSTLYIDSMVYERDKSYENKLKSIHTYMNGKKVFENISYYKNGNPKEYLFIDDNSESYFYKVMYDTDGNVINQEGVLFFQGYVDKINPKTLEVKDDGKRMEIKVFYPKPPRCITSLSVRMEDNQFYKVFQPNKYIPFLQQVWVDTKAGGKEWSEIDIWLELQHEGVDTDLHYNKPLFFRIVQ